jgi:pimeloyl-ACP methyl ester carboxylesterase
MRHLLVAFGSAGYRTAALDLRGFGASDKPPEGYTLPMVARDVAAAITALGYSNAVVAGHGLGALVTWTMAGRTPDLLRGIVPICGYHPASVVPKRRLLVSPRAMVQLGTLRSPHAARKLLPDVGFMQTLLNTWVVDQRSVPPTSARHYAEAMRQPYAAERAARLMRWATRPMFSSAQRRFAASLRNPATVPVLQVQTDSDPVLRYTVVATPALGGSRYQFEVLDGVGHLPAEEDSDRLAALILDWMGRLAPG